MKKIPELKEIIIELADNLILKGSLTLPKTASKLIVFAHGSGSGRFSSRNQFVANFLVEQQLGILLFDLLTTEEERIDNITREIRFNIPLLAERLVQVTEWLKATKETHSLKIGYFGASTGAAAALIAASKEEIYAVVSRGGRPDLAASSLRKVKAPTMLIVGGDDLEVLKLNQEAYALLPGEKKLEIVSGATHLFEEPGALEIVAQLAASWFKSKE